MDLYLAEIVADELASKSPEQVKNFSKIKRRAVANFVTINGDIDMREITREYAHAARKFWWSLDLMIEALALSFILEK